MRQTAVGLAKGTAPLFSTTYNTGALVSEMIGPSTDVVQGQPAVHLHGSGGTIRTVMAGKTSSGGADSSVDRGRCGALPKSQRQPHDTFEWDAAAAACGRVCCASTRLSSIEPQPIWLWDATAMHLLQSGVVSPSSPLGSVTKIPQSACMLKRTLS